MSYYPPTTKPEYQESCSRAILMGRLAIHTYSPGHDRSDGLSTRDLAIALRQASENPFIWTEESIAASNGLRADVNHCPHSACVQAFNKGPVGLKKLFRTQIGDKDEVEYGAELEEILSEYQDLMSGAKLSMAKDRIEALASLLVEPSAFDADAARSKLRESIGQAEIPVLVPSFVGRDGLQVPPQERQATVRGFTRSDGALIPIFSSDGIFSSIEDVQARLESEFAGNQRAVTRTNAYWNAFQSAANATHSDSMDPSWTLETVKTGHLSGAAWYRPEGQSYSFARR